MEIKEDYCNFETAKLLKEKGFDAGTNTYYYSTSEYTKSEMYKSPNNTNWNNNEYYYSAPTHQMAMKWLRKEHKIFIYIEPFITTSGLQGYKPYCTKIGGEFMWINPLRKYSNTSSDTYENAVEAALKYTLKNLI